MKTALLVSLLLMSACGFPPVPDSREPYRPPVEPPGVANVVTPAAPGTWLDYTLCAGTSPSGAYASDFDLVLPVTLGTLSAPCRPAAGFYDGSASYGGGPFVDARLYVAPDGVASLSRPEPHSDMRVYPVRQYPTPATGWVRSAVQQ